MRLFVLGIDSAEPELVFEKWRSSLPTISSLMSEGAWGRIETTVPPITCPAWPAGLSGCNPGRFGLYDLRYRRPGAYTDFGVVSSRLIKVPRIWDILSRHGLRSGIIFVPVTYPPSPIRGFMVSGFLTPDARARFTFPPSLRDEILELVGGPDKYIIDVYDYRRKDPRRLYEELREKTEHDFKIIRHLLTTREWDFFMAVIMTVDRAQHTLWKFFDPEHPRYVEDPELKDGLLELYRQIDEKLGEVLELLPEDTVVVVVSDHGAKRMFWRINVNELLAREGYLKLRERPKAPISLRDADLKGLIDWEHTQAFALGAYVAQVFINVEGREPKGCVKPGEEYERVREEIADLLRSVRGPNGERLDNRVILKEEAYRGEMIDRMPDLTVYFDNLHYGANEALGLDGIYSLETAKGPDDSNHGEYGILVIRDPEGRLRGRLPDAKMEDLMPTLLDLLGIEPPENIDGRSLLRPQDK